MGPPTQEILLFIYNNILWKLQSMMNLGHCFYSFLIIQTVGRTLWAGDQPVASPLPTQDNTNTE
jgi:hypothetical protein